MINNVDNPNGNKRALKKIRRPALNRDAKDNDDPTDIDPSTRHIASDQTFLLNSCLGLVEQDRKIRIGTQFINLHFDVASSVIETQPESSSITVNLKINENMPIIPWQYATKRLESYGDAELKAWASRIEEYHINYPKIMAKYYELLASTDPQVHTLLQKAKLQARLACREIEKNYSFRKLLTFSNKETMEILSSSYSESFLEEIGHNIEDFSSWTKANGLPSLFDSDCSAHLDVAKNFLDCMPLKGEPVQQGPKYKVLLYNKDGSKREVEAQYFNVIEPTPEGLFVSGYFTMRKKSETDQEASNVKKVRVLGDLLPKFLAVTADTAGDREVIKKEENELPDVDKDEEKITIEETK